MLKIASVISFIKRHYKAILIVTALIAIIIITLFSLKGIVISSKYPKDITYGEGVHASANAFMSKTYFEYKEKGGKWTTDMPKLPGEYSIRSVGKGLFGKPKYGKEATFTIHKKAIEIEVLGDSFVYGELPKLTAPTAYSDKISCEEFIYSDSLALETDVEPIKSAIRISDPFGRDVTSAYEITVKRTHCSVLPRDVYIDVPDATHVYDGNRFSSDKYEISDGRTVDGDTLDISFESYLIDVGSLRNEPTISVRNRNGKDVTYFYSFHKTVGNITVTEKEITISTGSDTFSYDSYEHPLAEFELSRLTPLVNGHRLEIESLTSPVDAGTHKNIIEFKITDGRENKTSNYRITLNTGEIKILPKTITVTSHSDSWTYDGIPHSKPEATVVGLCGSDDYEILSAASIENAGSAENKLTVKIVNGSRTVTDNYIIKYTFGTLTVNKRSITVKPDDVKAVYDGTERKGGSPITSPSSPNELVAGHKITATVSGGITNVGSAASTLSNVKITGKGGDVTANYSISTETGTVTVEKRPISVIIISKEKEYDGTPLTSTSFRTEPVGNLSFALVSGQGIKSVITDGSITEIGICDNNLVSCEIYDQSGERCTDNYEIIPTKGTLEVTKRAITVYSGSAEKEYDETPLICDDPIAIRTGSLTGDHYLDMRATGTITDIGMVSNTIVGTIRNGAGKDVSDYYEITYFEGTLVIHEPKIETIRLYLYQLQKYYDGTPLTFNNDDYEIIEIEDGLTLELDISISLTEAGEKITLKEVNDNIYNYVTYKVYRDGSDVTRKYRITFESLGADPETHLIASVNHRPIEITANSITKEYDGEPLSGDGITISFGSLLSGHSIASVTLEGTITSAGSAECKITEIIIVDENDNDVTSNYEITKISGTLTVIDTSA